MRVSYKKIKEAIMADFPEIEFIKSSRDRTYTKDGNVYLDSKDYAPKTMTALFNILHEIGHVLSDETYMSRAEREWRATMWAIFVAKRYGVEISDQRKQEFQDDIYFWYDVEKNLLGHKIRMSKTALKLQWR